MEKFDLKDLFGNISEKLAISVCLIGVFVLIGWFWDIPALKSIFPGIVSMKANTALCFAFLGVGLWSLQEKRADSLVWAVIGRGFAVLVFVVGALTLCEYIFGWSLGIDQILIKEPNGTVMTIAPGRMALNTAVCFNFLGIALLLISSSRKYKRIIAQSLFLLCGCIAFLALLGYFYGVSTFYFGIAKYTAMALHTALAFIFIALGGIFSRPQGGVMKLVSADGLVGTFTRRFFILIVFFPVVVDVIVSLGVRLKAYDNIFAAALHAFLLFLVLGLVVFLSGFWILREEEVKKKYESELKKEEERYRVLYNASPDAIMLFDSQGKFISGNPATFRIFNCKDSADCESRSLASLSSEYQPDGELSSKKAARMLSMAMEKGAHFFEWKHKRLSGEEFWATVLLSKVEVGGKVMLQATVRDMDIQKTQEMELDKRIYALEKFQKLMLGREKRIIELKNEISSLKVRLGEKDEKGKE